VPWQIAFTSSRAGAEFPGRLMELVRVPPWMTLCVREGIGDCFILNRLYFCVLLVKSWRPICTNPSNQSPPTQRTLKVKFKVDDVVDAITAIDQTSVPVDENVAVAARRRR
jgi:hypothetical protein